MNRLSLLFLLQLDVFGVYMTAAAPYVTTYKQSCLQIKQSAPSALSGLYDILVDDSVVTVYCEMAKFGGGFTFIPREAVQRGKFPSLIRQIFKDTKNVLLRFQKKDGLQPFTLITQLPKFANVSFEVIMHDYAGNRKPLNFRLDDYIFLGMLPANWVTAKTVQGFRSNGKDIFFSSCGKPFSYFAFFPNHQEGVISPYHADNPVYETDGMAVNWRKTGIVSYAHRQVPNNFLFLTEMHLGGCGCYTSSERWKDALGAAIGLR